MKRFTSLRWLRIALVGTVAACAGEPTASRLPVAVQFDKNDDGHGSSWQDKVRFPDLRVIAKFRETPPAVDPRDQFANIGPEGGNLSVGEFEIIVPPRAVRRTVRFHLIRPADPAQKARAVAEFGPRGEFREPVTIILPGASTIGYGTPTIVWWNGRQWVPLRTKQLPDGRIQAETKHFSIYGTSYLYKGVFTLGG